MMMQLLVPTIGVPFLLGVLIAIITFGLPARRGFILALLIPLAAVIIHFMLEGVPSFPPIAAKQKLPIMLIVVAATFAILSLLRRPCSTTFGTILAATALALSGWLLGKHVLLANPAKTVVVLAVFLIVTVAVGPAVAVRPAARGGEPSALATALLGLSIAAALTAAFGAFVGMAQINGALAALNGGWLLIGYIRYLIGDDDALALRGFEGLAFAITVSMHLIMTSLFVPKAAPSAIIFTALPLAVAAFILVAGVSFQLLPRFLRPVAAGAATAVPSVVAIAISAALFQG